MHSVLRRAPLARLVAGLLIPLLSAGCIAFRSQPLDPERNAARLTNRRLTAKTWTLQELAAEAARHQPDLIVARAQYATARAAIGTAGERPNPTIALSPQIVTPYRAW